jgi:cytochrome c-type biogenesis protein CcmH/NrfF
MHHILKSLLLLCFASAAAIAQIPEGVEGTYEPHPEARKAISQLYSPYCPGLMLEQCPAEPSRILRDSIHALAVQGWTANELVGWMLANHGEEYRAVPQRSGSGLWAWILPPGALLAGFGLVLFVVRRMRRPEVDEEGIDGGAGDPSPEDEERLRAALRELELSEDPSF